MVNTDTIMTISVYSIMQNRDYPTAGDLLYQQIMSGQNEHIIILDMDGISLLPSMFLNPSLGRLIKENGVNYVKDKIVFKNIKSADSKRIVEYVRRFA